MKQISQTSPLEASIELDALPPPSATSTPERRSTNDTSHSLLSKTLFSLCFSESCTLFLLLMRQAFDAFNIRCAEIIIPHGPFLRAYSTRLLNWKIYLYAVLLNIIILILLSLCLVSTTSSNSYESHIYISFLQNHTSLANFYVLALNFRPVLAILAPLFVYFLLSSYIPLPDGIVSSGNE